MEWLSHRDQSTGLPPYRRVQIAIDPGWPQGDPMHRMRRFLVSLGLVVSSLTLATQSASAALIKPAADRSFPDIAADINGVVTYNYNPMTSTGNFHVTNTPYLIAGGPTSNLEYA